MGKCEIVFTFSFAFYFEKMQAFLKI